MEMGCSSVIKCLPSMHEAQSLIPSTRRMNEWMNSSVESVIFQLLSHHLWLWLPCGAAYSRMCNVVCSIQAHILLWWQPHFSASLPGRWCSFLVMTSPQSSFSSLVHASFLSPDWLKNCPCVRKREKETETDWFGVNSFVSWSFSFSWFWRCSDLYFWSSISFLDLGVFCFQPDFFGFIADCRSFSLAFQCGPMFPWLSFRRIWTYYYEDAECCRGIYLSFLSWPHFQRAAALEMVGFLALLFWKQSPYENLVASNLQPSSFRCSLRAGIGGVWQYPWLGLQSFVLTEDQSKRAGEWDVRMASNEFTSAMKLFLRVWVLLNPVSEKLHGLFFFFFESRFLSLCSSGCSVLELAL